MKLLSRNSLFKVNRFLLIVGLLIFAGCSREKNTFVSRAYHNINSKYNGLYHAEESLMQGKKSLVRSNRDNFSEILPIDPHGGEKNAKSAYSQMDRSIDKCKRVIRKHSMEFKRKKKMVEIGKWIDDAYMIMGQANFYKKGTYLKEAAKIFEFSATKFSDRPETKYEAILWLIKAHIHNNNPEKADSKIRLLDNDKGFPAALDWKLNLLKSEFYLLEEDYQLTLDHLTKVLPFIKKKAEKARYEFILAQLNERLGNPQKAIDHYENVVDLKPAYDISFNAQLSTAIILANEGKASQTASIKKRFVKMAKDVKNKEYRGQIYFALGEIEESEGNLDKAQEYYTMSAQFEENDKSRQAEAYLRVAQMYYKDKDYINASAYYDSTLAVLPKSNPNFSDHNKRKRDLSNLVLHINNINLQDSLQYWADAPEERRDSLIDALIKEEIRKADEQEMLVDNDLDLNNQGNNNGVSAAGWYFDNEMLVAQGKSAFVQLWGDRKLEDNWRRSVKNSFGTGEFDVAAADDSTGNSSQKQTREYYIARLKMDDQKRAASDSSLIESLYNAGKIYRYDLRDIDAAIKLFNRILKEQDTEYAAELHYELYRIYSDKGDSKKAEKHKLALMTNYPDSEYAKFASDPNYARNQEKQNELASRFYAESWKYYSNEIFDTAYALADTGITLFKSTDIEPYFMLLKAMSVGRSSTADSMLVFLQPLAENFGRTPPGSEAVDMIRLILNGESDSLAGKMKKEVHFFHNPNQDHYLVMRLTTKIMDANQAKLLVSDFNLQNFRHDKLKIDTYLWTEEEQMLRVGKFENMDQAKNYYTTFLKSKEFPSDVKKKADIFIISSSNFQVLFTERNLEQYLQYIEKLM